MAGTFIEVHPGSDDIGAAMQRLLDASESLESAIREMGEYLMLALRDRFDDELAPTAHPGHRLAKRLRSTPSAPTASWWRKDTCAMIFNITPQSRHRGFKHLLNTSRLC